MCSPALLAVIPAVVSAASTAAAATATAAAAGTFLGIEAATWGTIGTVSSLAGTAMSAVGSVVGGQQQAGVASANADLARQQQKDALRIGSQNEGAARTDYRKFAGSQNAAMGASGVVPSTDVLADTVGRGERNAQTIRLNAERQAWGYAAEARMYDYKAGVEAQQGFFKAGTTLLGGTMDILAKAPWWKQWQPDTSSTTPLYGTGGSFDYD